MGTVILIILHTSYTNLLALWAFYIADIFLKFYMKEIELFRHIKDCIGMFVPNSTYDNYVSLIIGYDLAKDNILLEGFSEWLASKYKLPTNFAFSQQIKYYLF